MSRRIEHGIALLAASAAVAGVPEVPAAQADSQSQTNLAHIAHQVIDISTRTENGIGGYGKAGANFVEIYQELGKGIEAQIGLTATGDLNPELTVDKISKIDVEIDREQPPAPGQSSLKMLEAIHFYRDEQGKWAVQREIARGKSSSVVTEVVAGRHIVAKHINYGTEEKPIPGDDFVIPDSKIAQHTFQKIEGRAGRIMEKVSAAAPSEQDAAKGRQAVKLAAELSQELYDPNFSNGVAVPGILNGSVEIDIPTTSGPRSNFYDYPVILDKPHHGLNEMWVGIPSTNQYGQLILSPTKVKLGLHYGEKVSLKLNDKQKPILGGAGIYVSHQDNKGPDTLVGFDMTGNGNFDSVQIQATGMKR